MQNLPNPSIPEARIQLFIAVALFALAYILRLVFYFSADMAPPAIRADALKYLVTAINLVELGHYSYEMAEPFASSSLLVPGYPWFLAVLHRIGGSPDATLALAFHIQILMGALTVVLVYLLARRILPGRLAILPAAVVAILPHQVTMSSFLLTESLFCFLSAAALYCFVRATETRKPVYWVLLVVLLAYATLTRPIFVLLPLAILVVFWRQGLWRPLLLGAGVVFVTYGLWAYWGANHADLQESNMRAVVAYGSYPDFTHVNIRGFPNREDPLFEQSISSWTSLLSYIGERARAEPLEYLSWYAVGKPLSLWEYNLVQGAGFYIYPVLSSVYDHPGLFSWSVSLTRLLYPFMVLTALLTAIICCLMALHPRWRMPSPALLVCSVVMLYATFFHVPLASLPRFSMPFQTVMTVLAVVGLFELWLFLRRRLGDH